jgi:hypothetical protein
MARAVAETSIRMPVVVIIDDADRPWRSRGPSATTPGDCHPVRSRWPCAWYSAGGLSSMMRWLWLRTVTPAMTMDRAGGQRVGGQQHRRRAQEIPVAVLSSAARRDRDAPGRPPGPKAMPRIKSTIPRVIRPASHQEEPGASAA